MRMPSPGDNHQAVPGCTFGLPLADIIDTTRKRAPENPPGNWPELGGLRGRLNNPKFVASAPDEVVEEARANLAEREEEKPSQKPRWIG